jgi:hypothetical protein
VAVKLVAVNVVVVLAIVVPAVPKLSNELSQRIILPVCPLKVKMVLLVPEQTVVLEATEPPTVAGVTVTVGVVVKNTVQKVGERLLFASTLKVVVAARLPVGKLIVPPVPTIILPTSASLALLRRRYSKPDWELATVIVVLPLGQIVGLVAATVKDCVGLLFTVIFTVVDMDTVQLPSYGNLIALTTMVVLAVSGAVDNVISAPVPNTEEPVSLPGATEPLYNW